MNARGGRSLLSGLVRLIVRGQRHLGCVIINVLMFRRFRACWHDTAALTALLLASIFADRVQVITEPLSVLSAGIVDLVNNWVGLHVIFLLGALYNHLLRGLQQGFLQCRGDLDWEKAISTVAVVFPAFINYADVTM
jgi:hypothetical protein